MQERLNLATGKWEYVPVDAEAPSEDLPEGIRRIGRDSAEAKKLLEENALYRSDPTEFWRRAAATHLAAKCATGECTAEERRRLAVEMGTKGEPAGKKGETGGEKRKGRKSSKYGKLGQAQPTASPGGRAGGYPSLISDRNAKLEQDGLDALAALDPALQDVAAFERGATQARPATTHACLFTITITRGVHEHGCVFSLVI